MEIMARIKLASGREVGLARIDIDNIYAGVLEGSPEMVAQMERQFLRRSIAQRFWNTEALVILDEQKPTLPQYRCIAHFQSSPIAPENYYSTLIVCWFMEKIDVNLQDAATQVLNTVNWEAKAHDTHMDDL